MRELSGLGDRASSWPATAHATLAYQQQVLFMSAGSDDGFLLEGARRLLDGPGRGGDADPG